MTAKALDFIPENLHADIYAGTSTTDVAGFLNGGLASAKILELPEFGQLSIASTLNVPSGGGILGLNFGCTIKALANFGNIPLIRNATTSPASNTARDRDIVILGVRLDGNKANNPSATEFSHGVTLQAVDGARLDVQVVNPKGDGVSLQQSSASQSVGCSYITGKVRTSGCNRQGVAIICGEQIDLDVYDTGGNLMSVDLEPDAPDNFIRNVFIRLLSLGTGNGSDISGGVCVAGDGAGCRPTNVTVDFQVFNPNGQGAIWRDAEGLNLRGTVIGATQNGLVGIAGGSAPSRVSFDNVKVFNTANAGLSARETAGSIYDGRVLVEEAGGIGVQIENASGGTLCVTALGSGQQGLFMRNTQNMTFMSPIVEGSASHNVQLTQNSSGNRFQFLKSVNSNFGFGFLEESGCNDNRAFLSRVTGNGAGNVSTSGAQSYVQPEP